MAYVTPNSDIWILHGINLEPSYTHTLYNTTLNNDPTFALSRTLQFNTFTSSTYLKHHLTAYSYQRKDRDYIRVKLTMNQLYDCNYLIFKNTSHENRYFYAFIMNLEYINENTTEIQYKIDVMQTWWFDYSLNQCFVEREHSNSDVIGENTLPEPVAVGDYVIENQIVPQMKYYYISNNTRVLSSASVNIFDDWKIVVCFGSYISGDITTVVSSLFPSYGSFYGGAYHQITQVYFPTDSANMLSVITKIQQLFTYVSILRNQNTVISMYMCPAKLLPYTAIDGMTSAENGWKPVAIDFESSKIDALKGEVTPQLSRSYGSWTPHNNKLYTHPYCFYTVSNQQGNTQTFKYELFKASEQNHFSLYCDSSINPNAILVPNGYLQRDYTSGANVAKNYDHAITMANFPMCSWAVSDLVAKFVQGGMALATFATFKNPIPGISEAASTAFDNIVAGSADKKVRNMAIEEYLKRDAQYSTDVGIETIMNLDTRKPIDYGGVAKDLVRTVGAIGATLTSSNIKNSINNGNLNMTNGGFNFVFTEYHIKEEYAKIIDNFFDMYGYQTNKIKVPNRNARTYWTYTKTTNCTIEGKLPGNDMDEIQGIYNNGITFWSALGNIGNYGLSNTVPVG